MKNTVLVGGEKYSDLISKKLGGSSSAPDISFEKASSKLTKDIITVRESLNTLPEKLKMRDEFIVCIRMNSKYSAKSYFPKTIFGSASNYQTEAIGSRSWHPENRTSDTAKLIFAKTTNTGLLTLEKQLKSGGLHSEQFDLDVRRIEKIDLLSSEEKLMGFEKEWKDGCVEFVFHPFLKDSDKVIKRFSDITGLTDLEFRTYDSGITFATAKVTSDVLSEIKDFNPLRSVHPIEDDLTLLTRSFSSTKGPKPPIVTNKSKITVGVVDTGINEKHPYFRKLTENEDCTGGLGDARLLQHGTWVTGMILFGNLDQYSVSDVLPEPDIFVKSFKVLPQKKGKHDQGNRNEMYAVIDEIEKIVPDNPEIKVYNLSIGPSGQIYDDYITRFTYVCDMLTNKYNIQFCVAVGNKGNTDRPRIQSPSDGVNVLSVGAFATDKNGILLADYSSHGPGREGNKFKPDISAVGGSDQYPLQLVSPQSGFRDIGVGGTSLATPQVSAALANLIGKYSLDPLSARSLLLNKISLKRDFDVNTGHGYLPKSIDPLITCDSGTFTIQYRSRLLPGKFAQLQIPWPDNKLTGGAKFSWTLVVLADVDQLSTDEYTKDSMEISFYPNDSKYVYTSPDKKRTKIVNTKVDTDIIEDLISKGWTKGNFPKSASSPKPSSGETLSRLNMKWDSVVQGKVNIPNVNSINNPFFHLHCIARDNDSVTAQTDYCLTLTVTVDSDQDIYTPILQRYTALAPISITLQQKVMVKSSE